MTTIWKFPIEVTDEQNVVVPVGSRALTAQMQSGRLCIWAMIDENRADNAVEMPVYIHGTGHSVLPEARDGRYLSTVQMHGGALVFHVFVGGGF